MHDKRQDTIAKPSISYNSQLAEELRRLIPCKTYIVFVGAGLSESVYSGWEKTVEAICVACQVSSPEKAGMFTGIKRAEILLEHIENARQKNEAAYLQLLKETFGRPIQNTNVNYEFLSKLDFQSYITTNFDPLLAHEARKREKIVHSYPSLPVRDIPKGDAFYIHGLIKPGESFGAKDIVFSKSDFDRAYDPNHCDLFSFLDQIFIREQVLFIGHGLSEPPLIRMLELTRKKQKAILERAAFPHKLPPRYILLPMLYYRDQAESLERDSTLKRNLEAEQEEDVFLSSLGVSVLRYEPKEEFSGLAEVLQNWAVIPQIKVTWLSEEVKP